MSGFFGLGPLAGLVVVKCPRCGAKQLRRRVAPTASLYCKKCHRSFTRADGEKHRDGKYRKEGLPRDDD